MSQLYEHTATMQSVLPTGWSTALVKEVMTLQNGFAFKPSQWKKSGLPIIRIQNLNGPDAPFNHCDEELPEKFRVQNGDLLFAWSGTPGTSFGAHVWRGNDAWLNQHIFRVEFDETLLDKQFLRLAINRNLDDYIHQAHGGAGLAHITKGLFEASELLFPPLAEQRRIVAKVEELLSRVNAARQRLAKAPALLKRFRQSVLAAVCDGRLTVEWRSLNSSDEPPATRVKTILQQRFQRWEETESQRYRNAGRLVPDNLPHRYSEPLGPSLDELQLLPESWIWVRAEQVCDFITKGTTPSSDDMVAGTGDIPFIKVYNLTHNGTLDFSINPTFISRETHTEGPLRRSRILPDDVLMNLVGPPLGKVSLVPSTYPEWNTNQAVAIYRAVPGLASEYLAIALLTDNILNWAIRRSKATVGQHNLTLELARDVPIPFPPLAEQHEIVRRVEALFALADKIEARVQAAMARVEKITQAILAKAFRGELVPTEAELARQEGRGYEPASVLLERIRATHDSQSPRPARRRRGPKPPALETDEPAEEDGSKRSAPATTTVAHEPPGKNGHPVPIDQTDRNEVMAVIRDLFASGGPRDRKDATREIAGALGYRRTGSRIAEILDNDLRTAVRRGILENTPDGLRLLCRTIADYDRDFLLQQLTAAMGTTWWDREDLVSATARWLGFRRTGAVIQETLKATISLAIRRGLLESDGPRVRKVR
jgi:type I restriction enzyme S subunit